MPFSDFLGESHTISDNHNRRNTEETHKKKTKEAEKVKSTRLLICSEIFQIIPSGGNLKYFRAPPLELILAALGLESGLQSIKNGPWHPAL